MEQVLHAHHAQEDIIVLVMVHENFVQQDYMHLQEIMVDQTARLV